MARRDARLARTSHRHDEPASSIDLNAYRDRIIKREEPYMARRITCVRAPCSRICIEPKSPAGLASWTHPGLAKPLKVRLTFNHLVKVNNIVKNNNNVKEINIDRPRADCDFKKAQASLV